MSPCTLDGCQLQVHLLCSLRGNKEDEAYIQSTE